MSEQAEPVVTQTLPCPDCRETAGGLIAKGVKSIHAWAVVCEQCGHESGARPTQTEAIAAWNARAMQAVAATALIAWQGLPADLRSEDRPWLMGFNAGWEECERQALATPDRYTALVSGLAMQHMCEIDRKIVDEVVEKIEKADGESLAAARQAAAREVEGDSDNPLRVAEANAIYEGLRDDTPVVQPCQMQRPLKLRSSRR